MWLGATALDAALNSSLLNTEAEVSAPPHLTPAWSQAVGGPSISVSDPLTKCCHFAQNHE